MCYGELGCFESNNGPVTGQKTPFLPESPQRIGTIFTLFTREDMTKGVVISHNDTASLEAVSHERVSFIIHGFGREKHQLVNLRKAMLEASDVPQVITVNWAKGAALPFYHHAATNTQLVGRQLALLIEKLRTERNYNPKMIQLIGFSLGAQIAGFAGRWLKEKFAVSIGRISGKSANP